MVRRGETVFASGAAADKFYILGSGELAVWPGGDGQASIAAKVAESGATPLGVIRPGEGFGESALLRRQTASAPAMHSKTVTCESEQCEIVEILGADFLRLVEKSRVVRESFERLSDRRNALNEGRGSPSFTSSSASSTGRAR